MKDGITSVWFEALSDTTDMQFKTFIIILLATDIARGVDSDTPLPHVLRNHVLDDLSEFEFFPDGRLLKYEFHETEVPLPLERRNKSRKLYPFLSVESFKWKRDGGNVLIGRNIPRLKLSYHKDRGCFFILEHTWTEAKTLNFFDTLTKYCGDPVLRRQKLASVVERRDRMNGLPFQFLYTITPEGFKEYEFRADGTLLLYSNLEKNLESKKINSIDSFYPRFTVTLLAWELKDKQVLIDHGEEGEEILKLSDDSGKLISNKNVWRTEDHLIFIPRLFTFCGRPLPK